MIHVLGEPPFLARPLLQQPRGALGARLLEFGAKTAVARPYLIDVGMLGTGGMVQELAIARRRQRDHAQVYPQVVRWLRLAWLRLRRIHRHRQEERVALLAIQQIDLPTLASKHADGVGAEAEGDVCAPVQREQRDAIRTRERADALVVDHRAVRAER